MNKMKKTNNGKTGQMLTRYVNKAKQFPRIRSFFWLLRCADALNKFADMKVGQKGDNRTGIALLQILLQYPEGISQQSIAKQTSRTKQAITVAIDGLEKKGYVIRCSDSNDRRVNSIRITEKGIAHLSEVFPHTVAMCDEALSSLSEAEVAQLLSPVIKLTKNMWQKIESQPLENK
jgi:DNA-binding MarR family transcriptional regulator